MKFVADVMLGKLARLMRLAGYDVEYDSGAEDAALQKRSSRRVLLTKDRQLAQSATRVHFVRSTGAENQFAEIRRLFTLPRTAKARCSVCNLKIRRISKEKIRHLVPPYVFQTSRQFYLCLRCKRVYWSGTHLDRILAMIK
ncbi:MAG TPA: Mut7-C RNAse domain-containing protein [Acidobacteriota bacterium]|nr:Mut7-C RNAse domain-containing protein [Acidobacteriota bacterium]